MHMSVFYCHTIYNWTVTQHSDNQQQIVFMKYNILMLFYINLFLHRHILSCDNSGKKTFLIDQFQKLPGKIYDTWKSGKCTAHTSNTAFYEMGHSIKLVICRLELVVCCFYLFYHSFHLPECTISRNSSVLEHAFIWQ